jgi:hypothetical protein
MSGIRLVWYRNEQNCPCQKQSGTGIRGKQSGTGILQYSFEIKDAGMPMPAALALMLRPSYGFKEFCLR